MSMFWTAVALLGVLAGLLVLLPLRRGAQAPGEPVAADARRAENLAAYRQQLAELEAARASAALDDADFAAARLELDRRLLEDTTAPGAGTRGEGGMRIAWTMSMRFRTDGRLAKPGGALRTSMDFGARCRSAT